MKQTKHSQIALLFLLSFAIFSCDKKDDPTPTVDPTSESAVNNWIKDVMDQVYYWLDDMNTPIAVDSDPEDYFESLLNRPTDRFSYITPDYQELINSLNGITLEAGYEFTLYRESSTNENVLAEVTYIKKNSPASAVDLKRGDRIRKINDTQMTLDNYAELLDEISTTHTIDHYRLNEETLVFENLGTLSLTPVQLAEDPNYLDSIYTVNGQKVGYLIYNFFAPGPGSSSTQYDDETDAIFAKFKSGAINHLVLDFRYNGGGYVSSAVNLASLIAPAVTTSDIFYKTKYNSFLSQYSDFQNVQTEFESKTENLGNILEGNRVYILTSSRTASASELIINGLKPYMDVYIIGDVTYGKNVGSIPFEDEENSDNPYGILPIVTQSFNSLDQSDYTNGFTPDVEALESSELLLPLGNVNEILLRTALEQITGESSSGRYQKLDREDIGSTLDRKVRAGTMIEQKTFN
ncbi:S41 family peptidase [Algoriphagus zhangzhouensis]|uniref:Peptidase family S41 n=1 Tax=Algoriphagus zhangzhouensis TaxID=1073327 RepID=A0A1M7ZJN5_9BACT|nr:S41 family peptidase [Algoriphagus zhangzhouensis]TDY43486.1 peptidase S41-like protein [Algoriphagus zhangzhouensis]SHO65120.1 Peptidase family S41 [Algoriphagus zhangzhouensis]